jgi:dCTP deaminase
MGRSADLELLGQLDVGEPVRPLLDDAPDDATQPRHPTGILPAQTIRALIRDKHIQSIHEIGEDQIQPASIDLRLGAKAYRMRASFLPGADVTVAERIDTLGMHEIDLSGGAVLEKGCVYIVPLMESVALGKRVTGMANPKSSSGRLDVFTRLIADGAIEFDRLRPAYKGPLYAEISPRAFSIVVRQGTSLNQLRLRRGNPSTSDTAMRRLHEEIPLVDAPPGDENIAHGIAVTVDLEGAGADALIGYKARPHASLIDVDKVAHYDPAEFWEPLHAGRHGVLILNPGDFYILASKESVTVPPDHAAEMRAYDILVGEFRVHYAGFFDPGFGYAESGGKGSRAVLEVRSHEVPFVLEDGQVVGRLVYERLTEVPDKVYGTSIGSSYQRQALALAKQFKRPV